MAKIDDLIEIIGNIGNRPDVNLWKESLQAEVAQLRAENTELKATVARLQGAYDPAKYDAALTENAKLREAVNAAIIDFERIGSADWGVGQMQVAADAGAGRLRMALTCAEVAPPDPAR